VALAWLLQRSPVMLPIPGTASPRHLEENIGARDLRLAEEEMDALEHYRLSEVARRRRRLRHAVRPVAVPVVASLLALRSRAMRDH
jgi:diketogulonate reductase-like aldo/keto reductase